MKRMIAILATFICSMMNCAFAEVTPLPEYGMTLDIPDDYSTCNIMLQNVADSGYFGVLIEYFNYDQLDPYLDTYKETAMDSDSAALDAANDVYLAAMVQYSAVYCGIIAVETAKLDELRDTLDPDDTCIELGSNSTHTYFRINDGDDSNLSDEDKQLMAESRVMAEAIADSVQITEIAEPSAEVSDEAVSNLMSFSTVDMEGNTVTQDIFAQADLTIVNIWGTYCGPCIREMPDLQAWSEELPDNVQLIGLMIDVTSGFDSTYESAQKILSKYSVTFTNMLMNDSLSTLITGIIGTPTTLFIDRNGNQVHKAIVGAYIDSYMAAVDEVLDNKVENLTCHE